MSDKSVAEKAHVKPGARIAVLNRVPGIVESLGLPGDVSFVRPDAADLVFLFASTHAELEAQMPSLVAGLTPGAALWVFFRKGSKAAGLDMNRDSVWSLAEGLGMRPLGLVSVDSEWSAFRLRPATTPQAGAGRGLDDISRISAFMLEVDRLKGVLRQTRPLAVDRPENSAEHSWQVALLATLLASYSPVPVDVARAVEILLVHDIPEIQIGDVIVYAGRDPERERQEEQAARDIFGMLPEPHATRCFDLWLEYERRLTPEARYAYAIDRLMPVLHNLQRGGGTWREHGIALDQVLSVNLVTGEALPEVWSQIRAMVVACFDEIGASD